MFLAALTGFLLLAPAAEPTAAQSSNAREPESFLDSIREGKPRLQLRLRFENVDDDAVGPRDARAFTLRTALGYRTRAFRGWSFFIEAENITAVGNDLYNNAGTGSLSNGVRDRPVVADPALTEVNQALVRWQRGETQLDLGRQEITLGDHRFVGNVGWRQNHQSFDAFRVTTEAVPRVTLSYAFVDEVQRIFGDGKPMASHLLDARLDLGAVGNLAAYAYLLDFDRPADALQSRDTFGFELTGRAPVGATKILYEVEVAEQRDAADNPRSIDTGYRHLRLGAAWPKLTLEAGVELLEGDPGDGAFSTPLATLHKFNGWADKFLSTPPDGLEDRYLSLGGEAGAVGWKAVFHRFEADTDGRRYGDELDFQVTYETPWKQTFGLKGAFYDADTFAADTDKVMIWTAFDL